MRKAAVNLDNCMKLLAEMRESGHQTGAWEAYITSLHKSVFGWGVSWSGAGQSDGGVDIHALNSLQSLAAFVNLYVPRLEDDGLAKLSDMLTSEVLDVETGNYPPELTMYFLRVKAHLEWCITNFDDYGEFLLHDAMQQFKMTVAFMATQAPDESERESWAEFLREKFVWPFVTSVVTTGPAAVASSAFKDSVLKAIEMLGP